VKAHCRISEDTALAAQHPDWCQRDRDGGPRPVLCLNSQYVAKVIWPWMTRALADPACDGLDIEFSPAAAAPCWCEACTQHLRDGGQKIDDQTVRAQFAAGSLQRFKDETTTYAEAVRPGTKVVFTEL
jgi:hypothetical protein